MYEFFADVAVFAHFLWILFLIFGGFLGVRFTAAKIIHISALVFALLIQLFGWYCPLTHLELWFRKQHDPDLPYTGSFIIHYLEKIIYIELSPILIFVFTILLSGFNAWLYSGKRRGRKGSS
jgi:hypothetical protein